MGKHNVGTFWDTVFPNKKASVFVSWLWNDKNILFIFDKNIVEYDF